MRKVRKQAKLDGREWQWNKPFFLRWPLIKDHTPYPLQAQETCSQYELSLVKRAHENIRRNSEAWRREDEKLKPAYCTAKRNVEALKKTLDKEEKEAQGVIKPFKDALNAFMNFPPPFMPLIAYAIIYAIITLGEGYFNYYVFQMFGESEAGTWLMAFGIIATIPVAAHLCGHMLKKNLKTPIDWGVMIVSVCAVVGLLIVLAILREAFFETNQTQYNIALSPATVAMILIVFNITIFVVMTFLSYMQSRPDPEAYKTAKNQLKSAYQNMKKQGIDVKKIQPRLEAAAKEYSRIAALRSATQKKYYESAIKAKEGWIALVYEYRHTNMRYRDNKEEPKCFIIDLSRHESLVIPDALIELDMDCDENRNGNDQIKTANTESARS
jgi:TRAP-type C4-dicarboxylate transport system permease small subunit